MPADTVSISFDAVDSMIAAPAGLLRDPAVMAAANVILDALKASEGGGGLDALAALLGALDG